jgi:hypothetical protein
VRNEPEMMGMEAVVVSVEGLSRDFSHATVDITRTSSIIFGLPARSEPATFLI